MRQAVALILLVLAISVALGMPVVDHAYYAPDRGTPYEWFEGAKDIQAYFKEDYRAAGYIYLYVRNNGDAAITATEFLLNGHPCAQLREEEQSVIWWRLLPNPVPPGRVGEVTIRLRNPLTRPAQVTVRFDDGQTVSQRVTPGPPAIRIETVGFDEQMRSPFLVVERLTEIPVKLTRVLLDGEDVTAAAKLLDPDFVSGTCPITLKLAEPLEYGSYHVYGVRTAAGETVYCCVRTYDGWVPLASYGSDSYEEYARNGCNGHFNFGRHSRAALQEHARLHMRAAFHLNQGMPPDYAIAHPALMAYLHIDEPDVADYRIESLPHRVRIGYHAQELVERQQHWRRLDPRTFSMITIDQTYKPANYYIYGPLADMTNADCYPLMWGDGMPMTRIREVAETARCATGPRPLIFTFESGYPEPIDPEARRKRKLPRPMFPEEVRIEMLYAVGAGARGLSHFIFCTEKSGDSIFHGSNEYPEVWNEIGETYRALEHVAPLLALAHPTRLATSENEKIWVRTLICGPDALLLVVVNDDYSSERLNFRHRSLENVRITLPELPWWRGKTKYMARVTQYGFEPLGKPIVAGKDRFTLDRLDVGEIFVVTTNPSSMERLARRYKRRQLAIAEGLLQQWRIDLAGRAAARDVMRKIVGGFDGYMASGEPVGAYTITAGAPFWNPKREQHNVFEFGQNEPGKAPEKGAQWRVNITAKQAGQDFVIYFVHGNWGRPCVFSVAAPDGAELMSETLTAPMSGVIKKIKVHFAKAGEYVVRYLQPGDGPKGGRVSREIYVIPARLAPFEAP